MKQMPGSIPHRLRVVNLSLLIFAILVACQPPALTPLPTFACPTIGEEITDPQCEALVALYQAMGGENWSYSDGWLSDRPICTWYGITCDNDRIVALRLNNNNVQGKLPPEIGQLTSLRALNLGDSGGAPYPHNNQLTELPPEIGQLSNLEMLELSFNQLMELPPEIGQLSRLQYLSLGSNRLTKLPREISQLTGLQVLILEDNKLLELPPEFRHLTSLQGLYLSRNDLTRLSPEICQMPGLSVDPASLCSN